MTPTSPKPDVKLADLKQAIEQLTDDAAELESNADDLAWFEQIAKPGSATRLGLARDIRTLLAAYADLSRRPELSRSSGVGKDQGSSSGTEQVARASTLPLGQDQQSAGWRTINSAPRDGTRVLLWHAARGWAYATAGSFREYNPGRPDWRTSSGTPLKPTHWMPLPSCPAETNPHTPSKGGE